MIQQRIQLGEAATLLGVSRRMAQKLCQSGQLPATQVGTRWTTTRAIVHDYLSRPTSGRGTPCPTSTCTSVAPSGGRASKSPASTIAARYEQLIGVLPASG
jgi:excisionase family DNA binding protein